MGGGPPPFSSQPDRFGERWAFGIAWASFDDDLGGIMPRAHGRNARLLPLNVGNTHTSRLMYAILFGVWMP